MIEAKLIFEQIAVRSIVAALLSLPEGLRPNRHIVGEGEPGEVIQDVDEFLNSLEKPREPQGFFLKGAKVLYDINPAVGNHPFTCNCWLKVNPALAQQFLLQMAKQHPVFGFACASEEKNRRNRVVVKQGINTIESWVGRDYQKYVPGFYWLTLLPDALAKKHRVPIPEVEKIAKEHLELEGEQHLFRFYDRPEDWQATDEVAKLCASLPGVFDVEKVKPQAEAAKNFLELDEMLENWK